MSFVAGAALSGLIIQDGALRRGRRHGVVLSIESLLLLAAAPLFERSHMAGPLVAAMACGLQNAMATTYRGSVVSTSHISGMFTDPGIMLGHSLRGMPLAQRRLALSALVISCFFCGGLLGAVLFASFEYRAPYLPAAVTGITGVAYFVYRQWQQASGLSLP